MVQSHSAEPPTPLYAGKERVRILILTAANIRTYPHSSKFYPKKMRKRFNFTPKSALVAAHERHRHKKTTKKMPNTFTLQVNRRDPRFCGSGQRSTKNGTGGSTFVVHPPHIFKFVLTLQIYELFSSITNL